MLFKNEEERDSSELQGKRGGYGYAARIPLTGARAGAVRADGRGAVAARRTARGDRQVRFTVTAPTVAR